MNRKPAAAVVDAVGLQCPEPAFRARRALEALKPGEVLEILADDPLAELDLTILCRRAGHELSAPDPSDGVRRFRICKGAPAE